MMTRVFFMLGVYVVSSCSAHAQATTAAEQLPVWLVVIRELVPVFVTVLVGIGLKLYSDYTGVQIQKEDRERIHSAAMTGIQAALQKHGVRSLDNTLGRDVITQDALKWVVTGGAGESIARQSVSMAAAQKVVESKLGALTSAQATVAVTTGSTTQ